MELHPSANTLSHYELMCSSGKPSSPLPQLVPGQRKSRGLLTNAPLDSFHWNPSFPLQEIQSNIHTHTASPAPLNPITLYSCSFLPPFSTSVLRDLRPFSFRKISLIFASWVVCSGNDSTQESNDVTARLANTYSEQPH